MPSAEEMAQAFLQESAPPQKVDVSFEYVPDLSPEQLRFYHSRARYVLAYGERFSGKSFVAGHKIVKHCWDCWNAQAVVFVAVRRQATDGGILHTITTEILPEWARNQPGFEHSELKQDAASKDLYVWVKNKWGGWSMLKLVSMPHGNNISERVRGTAPSFIYVDELTKMDGKGFFYDLMQQIGRRPHIPIGDQQWVSTTNPEGPSHWVHKAFFEDNKLEDGSPDPDFDVIHLPIGANPTPRAKEYFEQVVKKATKHDPIEYRRLVLGEWIDRPSGLAIFKDHFFPNIHVKGDAAKGLGLAPKKGYPIVVGHDLGDCNHGVCFLQERPVEDRRLWVVFDEIAITDKNTSFESLVPMIMDKMNYWCEALDYNFTFQHISDKSAFNRFRSASGSYDHLQIQRISRELLETGAYPRLTKPIKFTECPKPPGSVAARIKMLWALLGNEEIFFSAKCTKIIDALARMESEKDDPFQPSRDEGHIHIYDALTYALFYHALGKPPPVSEDPVGEILAGIMRLGGRN